MDLNSSLQRGCLSKSAMCKSFAAVLVVAAALLITAQAAGDEQELTAAGQRQVSSDLASSAAQLSILATTSALLFASVSNSPSDSHDTTCTAELPKCSAHDVPVPSIFCEGDEVELDGDRGTGKILEVHSDGAEETYFTITTSTDTELQTTAKRITLISADSEEAIMEAASIPSKSWTSATGQDNFIQEQFDRAVLGDGVECIRARSLEVGGEGDCLPRTIAALQYAVGESDERMLAAANTYHSTVRNNMVATLLDRGDAESGALGSFGVSP